MDTFPSSVSHNAVVPPVALVESRRPSEISNSGTLQASPPSISRSDFGKTEGTDLEQAELMVAVDLDGFIPRHMRADRPEGVATYKTSASLVCVVAGSGVLALPHALAMAGWVGALLIFLSLFMSIYTGVLLVECLYLKTNQRRDSFQAIARDAFGVVGQVFTCFIVVLNLFGCGVLYMILATTLLKGIVADYAHKDESLVWFVLACSVFVWVCLIFTKSMKEVAFVSITGSLCTVFVVVIVVGISINEMATRAAAVVDAHHDAVIWSQVPVAIASISFAFGGSVVFPHCEESMAKPREWRRAIQMAMWTCFVMYITIALVGYAAYGDGVKSPILDNMPKGGWSIAANVLITLHVMLASPILLTSLSIMVEKNMGQYWTTFKLANNGPGAKGYMYRAIDRSVIVVLVAFVALFVPYFGDVMNLLSATTQCLLVYLMPITFYWKLGGYRDKSWSVKVFSGLIVVIATVAMIWGTISAVKDLSVDIAAHKQ